MEKLKIGIITWNENGWCPTQLKKAMRKRKITPVCFSFNQLTARLAFKPRVSTADVNILDDLDAVIVRPVGRGSLEEIIFRMDLLHRLQRLGKLVINPSFAIERSVDKYHALALLEENNIPIPPTAATENCEQALQAFQELGGDVVIKPIFGSRGIGSTRISDVETATRIFRAISFYHGVIYIQKFIQHGAHDIRAFVIGNRVAAAMRRVADTWKTNISLGAKPVSIKISNKLENLAVKAAHVIGCKIAGVDIVESRNGPFIIEVNSQPGWRGLQSVTKTNIADEIIKYVLSELKK